MPHSADDRDMLPTHHPRLRADPVMSTPPTPGDTPTDSTRSTGAPRVVGTTGFPLDPLGPGELGGIVGGFAAEVRAAGGRALVVGGAVRDALLTRGRRVRAAAKDIDVEVFGLTAERVADLLGRWGEVDSFGEAFAVFKLAGHELDVSLPRRERKHGTGHRGFLIEADPSLPPEHAARRRDFTINAISWDPLTGELVDPVGGVADLEDRRLRHVGPAFAEDPLRVLRAAQFVARFDLRAAPETVVLCRGLLSEAEALPRERIAVEWEKLLRKGTRPGNGLHFLDACGWIDATPELAALRGVEQDPVWHPEGDVFVHTAHVLDEWARRRPDDREDALITGLAALCHDLGKPATTEFSKGRWRAHGHEHAGAEPTRQLLGRITLRKDLVAAVVPLVENHLAPSQFFASGAGAPAVRRLANRVSGRLDRLVTVAHADQAGRPPLVVDRFEAGEWLLATAERLAIGSGEAANPPIIRGRDLLPLGLEPGPTIGRLLSELYEAQLDGCFDTHDDGLLFARRLIGEECDGTGDPAAS